MPKSRREGGSQETSSPPKWMLPRVCVSRPAMQRSSGRLAAAGGTEKADELAFVDAEADVGEGAEGAEFLAHAAQLQKSATRRTGLCRHDCCPLSDRPGARPDTQPILARMFHRPSARSPPWTTARRTKPMSGSTHDSERRYVACGPDASRLCLMRYRGQKTDPGSTNREDTT